MAIFSTKYDMLDAKATLSSVTNAEVKGKVIPLGSELTHMGDGILGTGKKLDHVRMKIYIQALGAAGSGTLVFKLYTGTGSSTAGTLIGTSKAFTAAELNEGIDWPVPSDQVQENLQISYTGSAASEVFSAGSLYINLRPVFD